MSESAPLPLFLDPESHAEDDLDNLLPSSDAPPALPPSSEASPAPSVASKAPTSPDEDPIAAGRPPLSRPPKTLRDATSAGVFLVVVTACFIVALHAGYGGGEESSLLMLGALLLSLGLAGALALAFAFALDSPKTLRGLCRAVAPVKLAFAVFLGLVSQGHGIGLLLAVLLVLSAATGEAQRRRVGANASFAAALLQTLSEALSPTTGLAASFGPASGAERRKAVRHVGFLLFLVYLAQTCYLIGWAAMVGGAFGETHRGWLLLSVAVLLYWPISVFQTLAYGIAAATMIRYLFAASASADLPVSPSPAGPSRRKGTGLLVTLQTLCGPSFGSVCRSALVGPLSSHVAQPIISVLNLGPDDATTIAGRRRGGRLAQCVRGFTYCLRALQERAPRFAMVYVAVYGLAFRPATATVAKRQQHLRATSRCGEAALFLIQSLCQLFILSTGFVFLGITLPHLPPDAPPEEYILAGFGIGVSALIWVEGFWQGLIDGLVVHFSNRPDDVGTVMPAVYPRLRRLSVQEDDDEWY